MKFEKLTELIDERITGEWGQEPNSSGVRVIRTTNFTNEGKLDLSNVVERDIEEKKIEKKALRKGDIIIEKSGGGPTQPVGRVVFFDIDSNEKYLCNNFTTILRPKNNLVDSKYLLYQMLYLHKVGKTKKYQNKTTGIHNLNLEKYLQEKVVLPPLPDQLHIANLLSKAENLIAQRKESIRLLDEFLKSTFLEMFGDPVQNEKEWAMIKLSKLIDSSRGISYGIVQRGEEVNEGVPVIRIRDLEINTFDIDEIVKTKEEISNQYQRTILEGGEILISIRGTLGKLAIAPPHAKGWNISREVAIIPTIPPTNRSFLFALLKSKPIQLLLESNRKGVAQSGINLESLRDFNIINPPTHLQENFSKILEKVEALKIQYQQSLQELENLYGSLSQRAFNGELTMKEKV